MYLVEGGVFESTEFQFPVIVGTEECYGPFKTYESAFTAWKRATFSPRLDICCHRLIIRKLS